MTMKRLALILFCFVCIGTASAQTHKTINMTRKDFIEKVMDYEKGTDKWIYRGDKPCIIDFYTTWCGPCKRLAPILEELAAEYEGEIYIYKVDTEREPELAGLFGIRSIPTLLFCPMEGMPQMSRGLMPKENLIEAIEEVFGIKRDTQPSTTK